MRSRALPPLALLLILGAFAAPEAQSLRKIGEMELSLVGLSATVDGARPAIPKNVASGVKIRISAGGAPVAPGAVARLLGPFTVEGELSGPSFGETVTVRQSVDVANTDADLILPLPVMAISGEHTLANLRVVGDGRPLFDLQPRFVPIDVVEQVLITSVKTRPLTLQEIKDKGIVLDSDDYLGFEFTLGLLLESKAVAVNFPVVFDREGVPLPLPQSQPSLRSEDGSIGDPIAPPRILPMMIKVPKLGPGLGMDLPFDDEDIRIPSVLVIPGEVGYLRQFFSAQLFVGNGTPATANLTVRDVTGKLILPPGADLVAGTADDPLSLAETVNGVQPLTMPIAAVGADGLPATADDVTSLRAGEQGQAEFLVRGDLEGYHSIAFDIEGTLDGLATGPIPVTGRATGGVLVRNPFFDVSFVVPTVVRRNEPFTLYATVSNKGQGIANDVSMTLDAAALSGVRLLGDASLSIATLKPGDAKTLAFEFEALRTGQVVASYLRFTGPGATGNLAFRVGVGERGVVLSPDTLVLPAQVDELPSSLIDAAMRVLGQAWSIANAPPNTLPAGVTRIAKTVVTSKALALAEAGLRITLGQPEADAIRDLIPDFHGPSPVDAGFDQLLRTTDAGRNFDAAVGAALASEAANGAVAFERAFSEVAASGRDFIAFAVGNGSANAGVDVTLTNASGGARTFTGTSDDSAGTVLSAAMVPLGPSGSAPLFGLVAAPTAGPYTLELTGRTSSQVDLSVTYPRGDGHFTRAVATGAIIGPGARARFAIDPSRAPPVLEIDSDANGSVDVTLPLAAETIAATAPQLLSATIVGPETFPSAGPYGQNLAMLFDRIVDPATSAQASRYSIPDNRVVSARSQLSGRFVFAGLAMPEGPYVPSSITVSGMADLRGVAAGTETRALQSRLVDPGSVVSGRVINSDGGSAAGIRVIYRNNVELTCETPIFPKSDALAAAITDAGGRYQFNYVWRDHCGKAWRMQAVDEVRHAERSVSDVVRAPGERVQADIALLGRGAVTGIVRSLSGMPVANAQVIAVSGIEQQVGGSARTDGDGRYTIFDITVGPVTVKAASGQSVGTANAQIARAGTTATADVTLNSGTVSVSGVVRKFEGGVTSLAAGATVIFQTPDPLGSEWRIAGVARTVVDGAYAFTAMPSGPYSIKAVLPNGDSLTLSGATTTGETVTGRDLVIAVLSNATVSGVVRYPDGTPAANPIVLSPSGGAQGNADGTFTIENFKFLPEPQTLTAHSADGSREGSAKVLVNQSGQVLTGVVITLGGLGKLNLTVIDSAGQPVRNQIVMITRVGNNRSPNNCTGFHLATTDNQGRVVFEGLAVGSVHANSLLAGPFGVDVAGYAGVIPHEGATVYGVMRFGGGGSVTGVVVDDLGNPVFGADIEISSKVYQNGTCELWPGVSHRLRTDLSGRFRATGVPVGPVSVKASQAFFPTPVGAKGVIAGDGDELVLNMRLVNTIAGELSGTVFLPDGVTPAGAGVTVTALGALPDVVVSTNAEGKFHFAKIFPAGNLQVTARDPLTGGVVREQVVIRTGEDAVHNFRLRGRGTVRVKVVDGAGVPVPAALVRLAENDYPNETFEDVVAASNEGLVTFEGVHEGRFSVTASDVFARGGRVSGELPAPGTTVEVTVRMTVTGSVRGHFYMPDGVTPIPFGMVKLVAGNKIIGQASTSSGADSGAFEFAYVPAGTVRLEGLDPATGRSGVAVGQLSTEGQLVTLDVKAQGLGVVTGVITSNGVPQAGAYASVSSGNFKAQATADGHGRYLVTGVPEGTVSVTADLQGALQGVASGSLLGDGTTLSLDVALRASGAVTGVVMSADGVTPAPPSIVSIVVGGTGGGRYTAATDDLGGYRFDLVPAGLAKLSVDVIGSIDTASLSVDVAGAQTTIVPVQLIGVGSIAGLSRDSNGAPIGGSVTITGSGPVPYSVTLTAGSDGTFYAGQVLAGPYSAKLRSTIGGFTLYGTESGVVAPGATSNITVTLQSTGEIRGSVRRSDGTTLAIGADVAVKLGANTVGSTQALSDGVFTVTGVPLGTYAVTVHDQLSNGYGRALNLVLAANGDVADAGAIVLDDTAVAVEAVTPADGAIGVSRTAPIVVTFTDPLTSTTGVNVKAGASGMGVVRALSADGRTVTLTNTWPDSTEMTVDVGAAVTDIFGRHPVPSSTRFRTVDTSGPEVTTVSPLTGAIQVAGTTAIAVTFSEPITNTSAESLISVTGPAGAVAGSAAVTSPTTIAFTPAAALADNAVYTVTVDGAIDGSGNEQGAAFVSTFATVDTGAPVLTVTSPSQTAWTRDATPFVRVAYSDAVSGVQSSTATMSLDGTPVSPAKGSTEMTFNSPVLADGTHAIGATVTDRAGNPGTLPTATFMLDATDPSVAQLTNVTEGQVITGATPISATATDNLSGVAKIYLRRNGSTVLTLLPPFTGSWNGVTTDGVHALTVAAEDAAGNEGPESAPISVIVNRDPLVATITAPVANFRTRRPVAATATVNEPVARVEFTLGAITVSDTSSPYAALLDVAALPEGNATLTVRAFGLVGEVVTQTRTIVIDRSSPVARWPFDEGTGATTADVSGNGHTGTLQNGAAWSTIGQFGKSIAFDGIDDAVAAADAEFLDASSALTMAAWVLPTAGGATQSIIYKSGSGHPAYSLALGPDGRPEAVVYPGGHAAVAQGVSPVSLNLWTHLAATYDGASLRLFVNGAEVANVAASGALVATDGGVWLGRAEVSDPFTGKLDEVRLYDRALGAAEVLALGSSAATGSMLAGQFRGTYVAQPGGTVWAFGQHNLGSLGIGSGSAPVPTAMAVLNDIVAIAASGTHGHAITSAGALYGWGSNSVGDGTTSLRSSPVLIALDNVVSVAAGASHGAAVLANGDAYTWGTNSSGQLGDGTTTASLVPKLVMTGVRSVTAGHSFTLFVKQDGTVWGAGVNSSGQLGDGTTTQRLLPVKMNGITTAAGATAGNSFSVIRLADGTLKATGSASEIGDGTSSQRNSPVTVLNLTDVVAIDAGSRHTIALKADGTVWAWGRNQYGSLGDGTDTLRLSPVPVPGLSNIVDVGAGEDHSLAVTADGVVYTWGENGFHEIGDGTTLGRWSPVAISTENYTWKVATPTTNYGSGNYGNNLTVRVDVATAGATIHYTRTGAEPTEGDPTVADGGNLLIDSVQTLSLRAFKDGLPPSNTEAVFYDMQVSLPNVSPNTSSEFSTPQTVTMSTGTAGATLRYTLDGSEPTETSTPYSAPFVVSITTTVKVKGFRTGWTPSATRSMTVNFDYGTLAAPTIAPVAGTYVGSVSVSLSSPQPGTTFRYTTNNATPSTSSPLYTGPFTLTLTTTVKAKAYHADYTTSPEASAVMTLQAAAPQFSLAAGTYPAGTTVTVTGDPATTIRYTLDGADPAATSPLVPTGGALTLGNATLKARAFLAGANPSEVTSAEFAVDGGLTTFGVAGGADYSLAVTPDGRLYSWGYDSNGQLGDGTAGGNRFVPGLVNSPTGVVTVAASYHHSLIITADGRLWALGSNESGQLGDGTTTQRANPVLVASLDTVVAAAPGESHSMALLANGDVYGWGQNGSGQLGDGTNVSSSLPKLVMSGVRSVAAGRNHTVFLKLDGTVWATGLNTNGQLGDGSTTNRWSPVQMTGISDAAAVAAGLAFSVVQLEDGTLRATGQNTAGQIGDGTGTQRLTAVAVRDITNVVALRANVNHTLALRADGTLWAWGYGLYGRLGDGAATTATAPRQVPGLANVIEFNTGGGHSLAVTADGTVFTWGKGDDGAVGDGGNIDRWLPTRISVANMVWQVATPTFSVSTGTYSANQSVVVNTVTPGATIHYTRNGAEPTEADPTVASGGTLLVDVSQTLTAKAFKAGMAPSNSDGRVYTLTVATPSISPGAGTYTSARTVTMSTATLGATLRYTLDGTEPTESSTAYTGALTVATTTTVKAKGFRTGWTASATNANLYTMNFGTLAAPAIAPGAGTYIGSVTVALSQSHPGAAIRYTTNGGAVGAGSPLYTGPFTLKTTALVKTRAFHPDYVTSAESSVNFTLEAAAPQFDPPAGAYAPGTTVTITGDPATTIRYSLDGSDPTASHPAIVSGGTLMLGNYTLKARAFLTGANNSAVTAAAYTSTGALAPAKLDLSSSFSLLSTTDGRMFGWGDNGRGQLGVTLSGVSRLLPAAIQDLTGVVAVAAGGNHSLALTAEGRVWGLGHNNDGQLGDGTLTDRIRPVIVPSLSNVVAVAAGSSHSVALLANGDVYAWGLNSSGQIGDGTYATSPVPKLVMSGVTAIAAGWQNAFYVKQDGTVWGAGQNYAGQLGDGSVYVVSRPSPVQMLGVSNAVAVSAGVSHTVVRIADGTVRKVGNNVGTASTVGITDVAAVEAGFYHSFAIKSDGSLWAWGENDHGQIGDNTLVNRGAPVQVTSLSNVVAVAGGGGHSAAVVADGTVYMWGLSSNGQVGDGTTRRRLVPTPISAANQVWKASTPTFSVNSGTFGSPFSVTVNSLTPGATIHYTRNGLEPTEADPTVAPGGSVLIDVSQTLHAKAWVSGLPPSNHDASIYTMQVPTPTISPSAGTYTSARTVTLSSSQAGTALYYTLDGSEPSEASTLYTAPFAIATTTTLKVKGFKTGWMASATNTNIYTMNFGTLAAPSIAPGPGNYVGSVAVTLSAAQPGATIRYTTNGGTVGTGSPVYTGAFTLSSTTTVKAKTFHTDYTTSAESSAVFTLQASTPVLSLADGAYAPGTTLAITADPVATVRYTIDGTDPTASSAAVVPGVNLFLGNFTIKARAFVAGATDSAVVTGSYTLTAALGPGAVLSGLHHMMLVTPDGRVATWGANGNGQLGNGTTTSRSTPWFVPEVTGVIAAAGGDFHSIALKSDGSVYAWGANGTGQIGDGTFNQRSRPVAVTALSNVTAIAAGGAHSLALTADGQVWTWGSGSNGSQGNGSGNNVNVPAPVAGLPAIVAIAAGNMHSVVLAEDGRVFAWGYNNNGELGDGTRTNRYVPIQVTAVSDIVAIGANFMHTSATRRDGRTFMWGYNSYGELGITASGPRDVPVENAALLGSTVSPGWHAGMAHRWDGALLSWGRGLYGQLGDGAAVQRSTPAAIPGLTDVASFLIRGFSAAQTPSGDVWTWGYSVNGTNGDGTTTERRSPQLAFNIPGLWAPAAPVFNVAPGTYSDQFTLVASSSMAGAVIRYTTDGSMPTAADAEAVNGEIFVNASMTVRARVFVPGRAPSAVTTSAYVVQP